MSEYCSIDLPILQALTHIPTLTSFLPNTMVNIPNDQFGLLASFSQLQHLILNQYFPDLTFEGIMLAVMSCPQLQFLDIRLSSQRPIITVSLDDIFSYLPHLRELRLFTVKLMSLSPLVDYGLPHRLHSLRPSFCEFPQSDAEFIFQLHELTHLELIHNHTPDDVKMRLDPLMRQQLTPGSSTCRLPRLQQSRIM